MRRAFILFAFFALTAADYPPLVGQIVVSAAELETPSRRAILKDLFERQAGTGADQERVERFVAFLQAEIFHPINPPIDEDGTAVYDPVWILNNRLGQCGQTNRVLVDALDAAGYRSRLIQLNGHVAAEAFFDGGWHYLDADGLSEGDVIRKADGTIPSAADIITNPSLIDHIEAYREVSAYPVRTVRRDFRYADAFKSRPYAYVKTATPEDERNHYYGWNRYRAEPIH